MVYRILFIALTVGGTWLLSSVGAYAQPPHVVALVQERLIERGYYPGPVDGVWGRRTTMELRRYQMDNGLPVTGDLNPPTARSLNISSGPRPVPPSPQPPLYRDPPPPGPPPPSPWDPHRPRPPYPPPY